MKFKSYIDINKSQEIVAQFFGDPKYLKEYQEGFLRKEVIQGEAGENGTISKMYYKMGKREMELTETIVSNKLPHTFEAFYHHKHMDNTLRCKFTALSKNSTRYKLVGEYTAFRGLIPNILRIFFPNMFKKQAEKWMVNFKNFVEKQ